MNLFDEIDRTYLGPSLEAEPGFSFLNRSARPEVEQMRSRLEEWFARYPQYNQLELRSSFRSKIDTQHKGASFELMLHELLLKLGFRLELHPEMPDTTTRPDFLAESSSGERFYVEAKLATGESAANRAAEARMKTVFDALNKSIVSPNFFLALTIRGQPESQPTVKELVRTLNKYLSELDPDEIAELYESRNYNAIPTWQFDLKGWVISIQPIPKKADARGKPGVRPIGLVSTGFHFMDDRTPVREAIMGKAGRYGDLGLSYFVAVNALAHVDGYDVAEALFGQEQETITFSNSNPSEVLGTRSSRVRDGAWFGPEGPRYKRVSGVLLATQFSIWSLSVAQLRVYQNPWATYPNRSVFERLPQAIPEDGRLKLINGESVAEILGLQSSEK